MDDGSLWEKRKRKKKKKKWKKRCTLKSTSIQKVGRCRDTCDTG